MYKNRSSTAEAWLVFMIAGLGVISESYFLRHPGNTEAKSAKYHFFFSGFSMARPCHFLLFPWSIHCVCIWLSSNSLKKFMASSLFPKPGALTWKKKKRKTENPLTLCFSWSNNLPANRRFWSQGLPMSSQHTSLFKQSVESFPDPKLLQSINCPSGFMATLFHIH